MPLTLVTGLPGHAKTLYTIDRWMQECAKQHRPVFYDGIKGCRVPNWQPFKTEEWESLPPGAVGIIDEAQFKFPVTGRGQTPAWVQNLSVHRHGGIDLVVITQHPMLLDSFVRRLIDRHFHVVRKFGLQSAVIWEKPTGCVEDVQKPGSRKDMIRHDYRYNKAVYELYDSAEKHTVKARLPMRLMLIPVAAVAFLVFAWLFWSRINPDAQRKAVQEQVAAASPQAVAAAPGVAGVGQAAHAPVTGQGLSASDYAAAYTPRIAGLPHTAPVYDSVTQPQQAPYPAACIASQKRCQCYSQQGTRLDMADQLCRQLADGGFFVAWNAAGERVQQAQDSHQAPSQQPGQPGGQVAGSFGPSAPVFTAAAHVDEDAGNLPRRVRRAVQ